MKYTKLMGILLGAIALFICSGCFNTLFNSQTEKAPQVEARPAPQPLHVQQSKPIAFLKVLFRIPDGTKTFFVYSASGRLVNSSEWTYGTHTCPYDYRVIAHEELRRYGYSVVGKENILFNEDDSFKARYQLAGVVDDFRVNIYSDYPKNRIEIIMDIKWQVRDTHHRKTVFSAITKGIAESTVSGKKAEQEAFRDGLLRLLENKRFAKTMDLSTATTDRKNFNTWIPIHLRDSISGLQIPRDINTLMQGVVLIQVGKSHGTGFFVSSNGYILTAAHVVEGVKQASVTTKSGLELPAKVIRINEGQDLALLKVTGNGHFPLPIETSTLPSVGEELYVIGSPVSKHLSFSVAKGIVSAIRRDTDSCFIQTDASMNPGNSGGPLLNSKGRVVGIASRKIFRNHAEGLSFGVPTSLISKQLKLLWKKAEK